jgi:hypothetical protein
MVTRRQSLVATNGAKRLSGCSEVAESGYAAGLRTTLTRPASAQPVRMFGVIMIKYKVSTSSLPA